MEFYKDLYVSEKLVKRQEKIINALKQKQSLPFIHVITLPLTVDGMLEIYPAYVLMQSLYQELPIKVVGIASNRGEAGELVQEMIRDCLDEHGNVDLKQYFEFD